jgi:tetratricopeptide (TPR) repeat protein
LICAALLFAQDDGADPSVLAKQLMDKRDFDGAVQAWRAVLARAASAGDSKTEAQAWLMIGRCFVRKQELAQAVDAFSSSANSADAAGDNAQLGDALNGQMSAEYGLGRFDEAEKHGRRAGEAYAAVGDRRMVTGMKINVAVMLGEKGDLDEFALQKWGRGKIGRDALGWWCLSSFFGSSARLLE